MISKRSQAISINFLVKFILAIVMFGLGVTLLWNIYDQSTSTAQLVNTDLQSRIVDLNCKPAQVVCVSATRVQIAGGKNHIIDFEIHNAHGVTLTYRVDISLEDPANNNADVLNAGIMTVLVPERSFQILGRSSKGLPIGISTFKTTPKGWYTLRVEIDPLPVGPNDLPPIVRRIDIEII